MTEETSGDTHNFILRYLVPLAIVAGLSFWNYNNFATNFHKSCVENAGMPEANMGDRFCSCASDKFLEETNYLFFVPIIGRMFEPTESVVAQKVNRIAMTCATEEFGL